MTLDRVCILGAGSWGTAASGLVSAHAQEVRMWAHEQSCADYINTHHKNPDHLVEYTLADNVYAGNDFSWALEGASAIVMVVPSMFVRSVAQQAKQYVGKTTPVIILTKGMEEETHNTMSDIVIEEWGNPDRIAVLSGPNHAEEICLGKISAAVIASTNTTCSELFQKLFLSDVFRIYLSSDVIGVEICAAVKNIVAIACGACVGMGYGDNTLAVLMCRGIAEIGRIVSACGGDPLTCMGLAGVGDLIATCTSPHSRNRTFGLAYANGETLASYESRTHMVVEGVRAAKSIWQLCQLRGIEAPLTEGVYDILYNNAKLEDAVVKLLERVPTQEFYGLNTNE